jgi:recombination protein RecA
MNSAAELRKQIESALADRIPSALSPRPAAISELISCGIPEIDSALGGGLPLGGITELAGPASSGRTTFALSTLAKITRQQAACAYVDVSDCLDPLSAASLGVDLRRFLWIRTGDESSLKGRGLSRAESRSVSPAVLAPGEARPIQPGCPTLSPAVGEGWVRKKNATGRGWSHPRTEVLGMDRAVGELFRGQSESLRVAGSLASAGCPTLSPSFGEGWETPVWKGSMTPLKRGSSKPHTQQPTTPWLRLDQALRATDLLLNTGGFRAIVLDMGDVAPEHARRVPLATWYRFRLQVEKSQTLFLLLTRVACANSCVAVSLSCGEAHPQWQHATLNSPPLLAGFHYSVEIARNRAVNLHRKKTVGSVQVSSMQISWAGATSWAR